MTTTETKKMQYACAWDLTKHGIDYADYFQGWGVAFTEFEECVTGVGDSEEQALDDALDQIAGAESLFDLERLEWEIRKDHKISDDEIFDDPEYSISDDAEYYPQHRISIRYSLDEYDAPDPYDQNDILYWGDVDLCCGGTFYDLDGWDDGYVVACEITDLGSASGAENLFLVEHKVILVERFRTIHHRDEVYRHDEWKSALEFAGPQISDILSMDREGRQLAISQALKDYGRYDPDSDWDNYHSGWSECVQVGESKDSEGWQVDLTLGSECELKQHIWDHHLSKF